MNKKTIKAFLKIVACYPKIGNWFHIDDKKHFTVEEYHLLKGSNFFHFTDTGSGFKIKVNNTMKFIKNLQSDIWKYQETVGIL